MKKGAYDFLEKPFETEIMLAAVGRAVEKAKLIRHTAKLQEKLKTSEQHYGLLGNTPQIKEVWKKINSYANYNNTILITGETGTGKELVAKALHFQSLRKKQRFVVVNMAAILETVCHSELFGHEKGSFTGAVALHKGKFEYANEGTLFLDEIDSASLNIQAVLLRAIEEKTFMRLGSNQNISVDVRIIAATNQDLSSLVEAGKFRHDLFHRLKMASIHIPPLRERKQDISLLAYHFLQEYTHFYNFEKMTIAPAILQKMQEYSWPGNVRELKHTMENLILSCEDKMITIWNNEKETTIANEQFEPLRKVTERFEREYISQVLQSVQGNLKNAAEVLQIAPRTLFDKMKKLNLKKKDFK